MADDMLDSGLFSIALSDSEDSQHADGATTAAPPRDRTGQSEEAFGAVKRTYRPKADNGEIWKSMRVPLGRRKVGKPEAQELLHAVEELYFYRRYAEAAAFVRRVFEGETGAAGLDGEVRDLLRVYERKCLVRMGPENGAKSSHSMQ